MLLYLVRHGDPNYADDCLTPLGKRQAEAVARRLSQARIDKIYTSPLGRAAETAQPTCELLKKEATILDWANEINARTLLSFLLHIPVHIMWSSFSYSHTGVSVINFANQKSDYTAPRCLTYCDLSHISADGQALKYNNKLYL